MLRAASKCVEGSVPNRGPVANSGASRLPFCCLSSKCPACLQLSVCTSLLLCFEGAELLVGPCTGWLQDRALGRLPLLPTSHPESGQHFSSLRDTLPAFFLASQAFPPPQPQIPRILHRAARNGAEWPGAHLEPLRPALYVEIMRQAGPCLLTLGSVGWLQRSKPHDAEARFSCPPGGMRESCEGLLVEGTVLRSSSPTGALSKARDFALQESLWWSHGNGVITQGRLHSASSQ